MKRNANLIRRLTIFVAALFTSFSSNASSNEECSELLHCLVQILHQVEQELLIEEHLFEPWRRSSIEFSLDDAFNVKSVEIFESSGSEEYDRLVLEGARKQKSFGFLSGLNPEGQAKLYSFVLGVSNHNSGAKNKNKK